MSKVVTPKKFRLLPFIFTWLPRVFMLAIVVFAIFGPQYGGGWNGAVGISPPYQWPSAHHLLGTDELGRDVLARIAFGARVSLIIGLSSMAFCVVLGVLLGLAAAFGGKWQRTLIMRFTDAMFSFPSVLLAILVAGILITSNFGASGISGVLMASGILPVVIALSITSWPSYTRLTYTVSLALKEREFVAAAKAMGASDIYLALKHVMPQLSPLIAAVAMVDLGGFILAESSFSFLGIGVMPPYPSWGSMINTARDAMNSHPMWLVWPCLFLSLTIIALNFIGDDLQARLDRRES